MMTYEDRNAVLDEVAQTILRLHPMPKTDKPASYLVYDYQFTLVDIINGMKTKE